MEEVTRKKRHTNEALLIIDMQVGCFHTPRYDKEGVIERINKVSRSFRAQGIPVIFIQHNGIRENYLLPGTEDFNLVKELVTDSGDYFVEKQVNSAFYQTELKTLLDKLNIGTLYITGLATDFCVNATVHSALTKDYDIVVISDCHTTADKTGLQAQDIIQYHNFLWHNLTPTEGHIRLKNHTEIISSNRS